MGRLVSFLGFYLTFTDVCVSLHIHITEIVSGILMATNTDNCENIIIVCSSQ